jgi:sirohydrochlorin cobaltochelatase
MRATILFAHGSRDPAWREPMDKVAKCLIEMDPQARVACAFLELTEPTLETVVDGLARDGVTEIVITPMFLGVGKHAREDLPLLVASLRATYASIDFTLRPSVGEEPQVIELLAKIALS